jgi:predicted kinase
VGRAVIPAAPGFAIDWPAIEAALAECVPADELARTPQDAAFHSEGDVWTHTRMVIEALVADDAWRTLAAPLRGRSLTAALAHDLGKPSTTKLETDGRITSRGHSARGEHVVREWLWRRGTPFAEREHICRLVRSHQVPFFAFGRDDAAHTVERLSLKLRNDLLVHVALADARGRRCADPADQARIVEQCLLYRELCADLGVLDAPRAFASDHTRVVWRETAGRRPADAPAFDDTTCEVTVMSGLPASGKDAWLAAHRPGLPVVSLDALREAMDVDPADDQGAIVHAARDAARALLREKRDFAWNATNLSERVRAQVVQLARDYGARVHVVYCEAPPDVLAARNGARREPVPAAAMARMIERWSVPTPDEAHVVTYALSLR